MRAVGEGVCVPLIAAPRWWRVWAVAFARRVGRPRDARRNTATHTARSAATTCTPQTRRAIRAFLTVTMPDSTPELLASPWTDTRFLPPDECTLGVRSGSRLLGENASKVCYGGSFAELMRDLDGALLNEQRPCCFGPAALSHHPPQTCAEFKPLCERAHVDGVQFREELHFSVESLLVDAGPAVAAIPRVSYAVEIAVAHRLVARREVSCDPSRPKELGSRTPVRTTTLVPNASPGKRGHESVAHRAARKSLRSGSQYLERMDDCTPACRKCPKPSGEGGAEARTPRGHGCSERVRHKGAGSRARRSYGSQTMSKLKRRQVQNGAEKHQESGEDAANPVPTVVADVMPAPVPASQSPRLLTRGQVADELGISKTQVRRLEARLRPTIDASGVHRFAVEAVEEVRDRIVTRRRSVRTDRDPGDLAAEVFAALDDGVEPADIVKRLRVDPTRVLNLHAQWAHMRGVITIPQNLREHLSQLLGAGAAKSAPHLVLAVRGVLQRASETEQGLRAELQRWQQSFEPFRFLSEITR